MLLCCPLCLIYGFKRNICCDNFQVDDEAMDLNKELMSGLLDLDDVDAVYTDQK